MADRPSSQYLEDYIREAWPCGSCKRVSIDQLQRVILCKASGELVSEAYTCAHWSPHLHAQKALGMVGNGLKDRVRRWWHTRPERP